MPEPSSFASRHQATVVGASLGSPVNLLVLFDIQTPLIRFMRSHLDVYAVTG